MQVTINIEPGQIGETVIDLFKNLSPEKKEAMALDVLREWLKTPDFFDDSYWIQLVIADYRSGKLCTFHNKDVKKMTDEEIMGDYFFNDNLKQHYHPQVGLVEQIRKETLEYLADSLSKEIAESPEIQKIKEATMKEIAQNFSSLIQQTMVHVFTNSLSNMQYEINNHMQKRYKNGG